MNISHLLDELQKSLFVGREKELAILHQTLSNPNWRLLNIHGPGGIGKTSLLQMFAQSLAPSRCLYFDGQSVFHQPNDFLRKLQETLLEKTMKDPLTNRLEQWKPASIGLKKVVDCLNRYAVDHHGVFLLLDTFEHWSAIENWLRNEWFLTLNPLVKVCIAGRYALEDQWQRGNWHLLVQNIELQPLSSIEVNHTQILVELIIGISSIP